MKYWLRNGLFGEKYKLVFLKDEGSVCLYTYIYIYICMYVRIYIYIY